MCKGHVTRNVYLLTWFYTQTSILRSKQPFCITLASSSIKRAAASGILFILVLTKFNSATTCLYNSSVKPDWLPPLECKSIYSQTCIKRSPLAGLLRQVRKRFNSYEIYHECIRGSIQMKLFMSVSQVQLIWKFPWHDKKKMTF